jgi:hypothetical protein
MRTALAAIAAAAAALVIANMLGVAAAEAPTSASGTAVRSVSVEGVATAPLEQGANQASADAAYRQSMANAIADGLSKAEFLASKTGVTLGAVQSVTEGGGSIECKSTEGEPSTYVPYDGEQPDFGHANSGVVFAGAVAPRAAGEKAVGKHPKRKKHKRPTAKKSAVIPSTCALAAQVSLVYAIG